MGADQAFVDLMVAILGQLKQLKLDEFKTTAVLDIVTSKNHCGSLMWTRSEDSKQYSNSRWIITYLLRANVLDGKCIKN